jgi:hypothetical protein
MSARGRRRDILDTSAICARRPRVNRHHAVEQLAILLAQEGVY